MLFRSYNISSISEHVKLPKNENEIYIFHGFKDEAYYKKIEKEYGSTVLDCEDFIIEYRANTIQFKKNNFLTDKKILNTVDFIIKDNDRILYRFNNQNIIKDWVFYIYDAILIKGIYELQISESETNRIIYKNLFRVN